jgi:dolichyl-phosphate beta-glucosyltransferase
MDTKSPKKLSIVIPAYNEAGRITDTLRTLGRFLNQRELDYEIIIVDDGSTDNTAEIASSVDIPNMRVTAYKPNRGKGYAVRLGLSEATGDYALFMDADGSTDISCIVKFLNIISSSDDYDVIIGSRATSDADLPVRQGIWRRATGMIFRNVVRTLFFFPYADTQCGFKMFSAQALSCILPKCRENGFIFDIEMLYHASKSRLRVLESGVKWTNDDDSRVTLANGPLKMSLDILKFRLKTLVIN